MAATGLLARLHLNQAKNIRVRLTAPNKLLAWVERLHHAIQRSGVCPLWNAMLRSWQQYLISLVYRLVATAD